MRAAFNAQFSGPECPYAARFTSLNETDHGRLDVRICEVELTWWVQTADIDADGAVSISGMTEGADLFWEDEFWFELVVSPEPRRITYFGDRGIRPVDHAL